ASSPNLRPSNRPRRSPASTRAARSAGSGAIGAPRGWNATIPRCRMPQPTCPESTEQCHAAAYPWGMPEIHFTKGQGTGNDFVLIADPEGRLDLTPEQLAAIADRRFGVGGDGVIRAVRSENLPEGAAALAEDPAATWFM